MWPGNDIYMYAQDKEHQRKNDQCVQSYPLVFF